MDITIQNNLRLTGIPEPIRRQLMETLTMANPKYLENQRMGRWNRGVPKTLRFYDRTRGGLWIPRGYLRQLILLCRRENVACQIIDRRRMFPPADFFFRANLKPFQETAVSVMGKRDFGTLCAPTGSGKTVMALSLIARRAQPALIVVHTRDLADQWVARIETFLGIPADEIGLIGGGKKKPGKRVTVALVQSLYRCAWDVSPTIGFLVVDECHRTPSRTFTDAVTEFDSRYMLGLSATPWRRDHLSRLIFWHLGDVHHEIEKRDLVQSGDVLPAEVIVRETNFIPYFDPVNEYSRMLSELTMDDDRNRLIADDVAREVKEIGGVCLVLSDRKKHCETIQALLQYKLHVPSDLMTGDLSLARRRVVLEKVNRGDTRVIVATGQLIGEGFDCPDLSTLFLATPIRFSGRLIQYLGRVLRPAAGKETARVFDYVDVHVEPLAAAAAARQRVYRR
jgi:superfamily II DNA or RNA helicase